MEIEIRFNFDFNVDMPTELTDVGIKVYWDFPTLPSKGDIIDNNLLDALHEFPHYVGYEYDVFDCSYHVEEVYWTVDKHSRKITPQLILLGE